MARIPLRFYGPAQLADTNTLLYTVPTGAKARVRHIHLSNADTAAHQVTLAILTGATAANRVLDAFSIAAAAAGVTASVQDFWVDWTLEAAETLYGFADAASHVVMVVGGEEIVLG